MDDVRAGVYRHYKGPLYLVLGLAHDANAEEMYGASDLVLGAGPRVRPDPQPLGERTVVVYIGLQLDNAHTGPRLAVRSYDDFFAKVHVGQPDRFTEGTVCEGSCWNQALNQDGLNNHLVVPRFDYVGPTWEGQ